MKPKFDHRIKRPFHYTPAVQTNIAKTIAREKRRIEDNQREAAEKVEQINRRTA